jgi:hypothetical protein
LLHVIKMAHRVLFALILALTSIHFVFIRHNYIQSQLKTEDLLFFSDNCIDCIYTSPREFARKTSDTIWINSTFIGVGRTGNIFMVFQKLIRIAFKCKMKLVLPVEHKRDNIIRPDARFSYFDFSNRNDLAHENCSLAPVHYYGDLLQVRYAISNVSHIIWSKSYLEHELSLQSCLKKYLGLCDSSFCEGMNLDSDSLVVHIRQGDIYNETLDSPAYYYGQPPLSYYVRSFYAHEWKKIIIVASSTGVGPVWKMLQLLKGSGALNDRNIVIQQNTSWEFDFKTLFCAKNLVESRSTLIYGLSLGKSKQYYTFSCFRKSVMLARKNKVYAITPDNNYKPFVFHDNTPEEWVNSLLHKSSPPILCD